MGPKSTRRINYIISLLIFNTIVVYCSTSEKSLQTTRQPLQTAFSDVGQWKGQNDVPLEQDIFAALKLDDYLFRNYQKNKRSISLYIGYYLTARKLGASHSPLVCFPGQGWEVSLPAEVELETRVGSISAEKLIVKKGMDKQLLIYWFQSYDQTSRGTLRQKLNSLLNKLLGKPEDNAFIRVSTSILNENYYDAYEMALSFINEFYPEIYNFITTEQYQK